MASSTRMAVALLSAPVSLVPMACGGDEAAMRATLTNNGCTYEGDTSPTAGMFTIEVENQTEFFGSFVLLSLAEGSTVDDLQPSLEQYRGSSSGKGRFRSRRTTSFWSAPTSRPEQPVRCLPTSPPAPPPSCALSTTTFPPSRFTSRSSWT